MDKVSQFKNPQTHTQFVACEPSLWTGFRVPSWDYACVIYREETETLMRKFECNDSDPSQQPNHGRIKTLFIDKWVSRTHRSVSHYLALHNGLSCSSDQTLTARTTRTAIKIWIGLPVTIVHSPTKWIIHNATCQVGVIWVRESLHRAVPKIRPQHIIMYQYAISNGFLLSHISLSVPLLFPDAAVWIVSQWVFVVWFYLLPCAVPYLECSFCYINAVSGKLHWSLQLLQLESKRCKFKGFDWRTKKSRKEIEIKGHIRQPKQLKAIETVNRFEPVAYTWR